MGKGPGGRSSAASADLVVVNARVWPSPAEPISDPQTVTVRGGVIQSLSKADTAAADLPSIDVDGRIVTAGFVNCHVHFTEPVWARSRTGPAEDLQAALDDMLLRRGFTTALDLSSNPHNTAALLRRIRAGELRGPQVITAGTGIRPWNGFPFYVKDSVPRYLRWLMPSPVTTVGARLTVAAQARGGARLTKLFTGSYVEPTRVKPMRLSIARAAVAAAHRRGMRVLAHPSNREGTAIAIAAGVDALAHVPDATEGTEELLSQAARQGVRVIPTLHMFAATVTTDEAYLAPIRAALSGFIAAGGRVLFGTDVGYLAHRDTRSEFIAMQTSGMSTADILRALTVEPAAFLARNDAGAVKPGYCADLTVLATGAVAPEPADLADVHAVIRDGRVIYRGAG